MIQLVNKRHLLWVALAVCSLVSLSLTVWIVPVFAEIITAGDDNKAEPSYIPASVACVGPADEDREFIDVTRSHAFRDEITCLAYYGITIGRGNGMFSPNTEVTRNQMVLFMTRTAKLANVNAGAVLGSFPTDGDSPI